MWDMAEVLGILPETLIQADVLTISDIGGMVFRKTV